MSFGRVRGMQGRAFAATKNQFVFPTQAQEGCNQAPPACLYDVECDGGLRHLP